MKTMPSSGFIQQFLTLNREIGLQSSTYQELNSLAPLINTSNTMFENFKSEYDLASALALAKLEALFSSQDYYKYSSTKDSALDYCLEFLSLNKIKLCIMYQDKLENGCGIKGVKNIELLRNFLRKLVNILASFPTKFLRVLEFDFLTICESVSCENEKLLAKIKDAVNRGFFILSEHYNQAFDLDEHIHKLIFYQIVKKVPNLIYEWRDIDQQKPEKPNSFPIKRQDTELFYCLIKNQVDTDLEISRKREKAKKAIDSLH